MTQDGLTREYLEQLGLPDEAIKEILVKAGVETEPKRLKYFVFLSDEEYSKFMQTFPGAKIETPPWRDREE